MKILGCGFLLLLPRITSELLSKSAMLIGSNNNKRETQAGEVDTDSTI